MRMRYTPLSDKSTKRSTEMQGRSSRQTCSHPVDIRSLSYLPYYLGDIFIPSKPNELPTYGGLDRLAHHPVQHPTQLKDRRLYSGRLFRLLQKDQSPSACRYCNSTMTLADLKLKVCESRSWEIGYMHIPTGA